MGVDPFLRVRLLERAENLIYTATAFILVFAAAGLLAVGVYEMVLSVLTGDYIGGLLHLLDRSLLVLMLAEIVYTVRRIALKEHLQAGPFFVVGIIAAIRRILVITAESAQHVDLHDPTFLAAMAELALLAAIVVALAAGMRLLPQRADEIG